MSAIAGALPIGPGSKAEKHHPLLDIETGEFGVNRASKF
jgi:hypothetical protein